VHYFQLRSASRGIAIPFVLAGIVASGCLVEIDGPEPWSTSEPKVQDEGQALVDCDATHGLSVLEARAHFGHDALVVATIDDVCPGDEVDTLAEVYLGTTLLAEERFHGARSEPLELSLVLSGAVLAGEELLLVIHESVATTDGELLEFQLFHFLNASEPMVAPYTYELQESAHSGESGCHGQGVKFDGQYFYSTCQDLDGANEARAFIHDSVGNLVCDFSLGPAYDHPGGMMLRPEGAYIGFGSLHGFDSYSLLVRVSADPCTLEVLNNQRPLSGTVSALSEIPAERCELDTDWEMLVYGTLGKTHRICDSNGGGCGEPQSHEIDGMLTAFFDVPQDCDTYFDGGWMRACITLASEPSRVRVYRADGVDVDGYSWEMNASGETLIELGGLGWSGGFGLFTSQLQRYIVTAPTHESGSCGFKLPCTGADRTQLVQFQAFDDYEWPSGGCQ